MTQHELVTSITQDISDRSTWDTRQGMFYDMRHHGLRRKNRMPWQADAHFPLCSQVIEKIKPLYFQQLYASELLATFVPTVSESSNAINAGLASQWFDYQMKQRSDLERESLRLIDSLCVGGRGVWKVTWDAQRRKLKIVNRPTMHIIVSSWTEDIETADRIVDVQTYSVESYKRLDPNVYKTDDETVRLITGTGEEEEQSDSDVRQRRLLREGITHSNSNRIIIWECWTRQKSGWMCQTLSPLAPEIQIRQPFKCPYQHGLPPFVTAVYEEKEAGWYSPRGLVEILATFEAECTETLNQKKDCMRLYNNPVFTSERDIPNTANLNVRPGQILPFKVAPVVMREPPINLDQHLVLMRDIGQQLVSVPDFALSDVKNTSDTRSATEINAITAASQQGSDLRMRVFRLGLGRLYRMCWSLLRQYAADDLKMVIDDRVVEVSKDAIADVYRIIPSGSADGVNKQVLYAKAATRFQQFANSPFIKQDELVKSVLEADDAGLVKRLFQDPGQHASDEREDQGVEICVMKNGIPASVSPSDDHLEHIKTIVGYVQVSHSSGQNPTPAEMVLLQQHIAQHLEFLKKTNPQAAKQAEQAIQSLSQILNEPTQANQGNGQAVAQGQPSPPVANGGPMGAV
jgi:hypothetical protein